MTDTNETTPATTADTAPAPHPLVKYVADNKPSVAYGLLLTAAVLVVLTVMASTWWLPELNVPVAAFGILLVTATLMTGLERLLHEPTPGTELDAARVVVLALGGLTGLALTVAAVLLAYEWWSDIAAWLDPSGPGKTAWRSGVTIAVLIAGLGLMFASLQLARTEERSSVGLRRLLYGYNAVLTGLLLLAIIAVVNVIVATLIKAPLDFTASANYTLASRSLNILKNLQEPVEIYQIQGFEDGFLEDEVRTLLSNCREQTSKVEVKEVALHTDPQRARELAKKYSGIGPGCILVVNNPGAQEDFRVIQERELMQAPERFDPSRSTDHKFTGEDALMTVLSSMSEGKKLSVVYFTQGHNELDLNDAAAGRFDVGAGILKKRLEARRNYEVKALKFDPVDAKVPDDAGLVVIAGPRLPFADTEASALRAYMNRKGKLLVLLDVVIGSDKKLIPSGLEGFLQTHGVTVPNQRLLTLPLGFFPPPNAVQVIAQVNPQLAQTNPLAAAFENDLMMFENARPLNVAANPPGASRFNAQSLLQTRTFSWPEGNFDAEPTDIVSDISKNAQMRKQKATECKPETIGAVVTESNVDPSDPHAAMRAATEQKPRMVVFGNASMASNRNMQEQARTPYFSLIASCIEWLREKEANIGIEPKKRDAFVLMPKTKDEGFRMIFLPPILIVTAILGLGTGVWIMRRR